jgi:hypothetical protein
MKAAVKKIIKNRIKKIKFDPLNLFKLQRADLKRKFEKYLIVSKNKIEKTAPKI